MDPRPSVQETAKLAFNVVLARQRSSELAVRRREAHARGEGI